jgi:preprotein translocase subunit SecG
MYTAARVILVIVSVLMATVILTQSGRSAGLGALTGGGNEAAGNARRGKGTDPILARVTSVVAIIFYLVAIYIAWIVTHSA